MGAARGSAHPPDREPVASPAVHSPHRAYVPAAWGYSGVPLWKTVQHSACWPATPLPVACAGAHSPPGRALIASPTTRFAVRVLLPLGRAMAMGRLHPLDNDPSPRFCPVLYLNALCLLSCPLVNTVIRSLRTGGQQLRVSDSKGRERGVHLTADIARGRDAASGPGNAGGPGDGRKRRRYHHRTEAVSSTYDSLQITNLPTNYRASGNGNSPYYLLTILPGMQSDNGGNLSIQGGLQSQSQFTVDGISTTDTTVQPTLRNAFPSAESIAEIIIRCKVWEALRSLPIPVTWLPCRRTVRTACTETRSGTTRTLPSMPSPSAQLRSPRKSPTTSGAARVGRW